MELNVRSLKLGFPRIGNSGWLYLGVAAGNRIVIAQHCMGREWLESHHAGAQGPSERLYYSTYAEQTGRSAHSSRSRVTAVGPTPDRRAGRSDWQRTAAELPLARELSPLLMSTGWWPTIVLSSSR